MHLAGVTIREEGSLVGSADSVGDINFVGNYISATASGIGAIITLSDITLGTDTIGNYVASISGTANEIEVTNGTSEGSTPQIGLPDDVTLGNKLSVSGDLDSIGIVTARSGIDANGDINVSAGNSVTAPNFYGDGSGLTGITASQVGAITSADDITGNAGIATTASNVTVTGSGNDNTTTYPFLSNSTSGSSPAIVDTDLSYNPNTNLLTAGGFSGDGSSLSNITAGQVGAMGDLVDDTTPQLGGDLDLNSNDITGTGDINITGDISATTVSITGTLTYEDVTNVDSVGLITARAGIRVTNSGLVVNSGVSTFNDSIYVERGTYDAGNDSVTDAAIVVEEEILSTQKMVLF